MEVSNLPSGVTYDEVQVGAGRTAVGCLSIAHPLVAFGSFAASNRCIRQVHCVQGNGFEELSRPEAKFQQPCRQARSAWVCTEPRHRGVCTTAFALLLPQAVMGAQAAVLSLASGGGQMSALVLLESAEAAAACRELFEGGFSPVLWCPTINRQIGLLETAYVGVLLAAFKCTVWRTEESGRRVLRLKLSCRACSALSHANPNPNLNAFVALSGLKAPIGAAARCALRQRTPRRGWRSTAQRWAAWFGGQSLRGAPPACLCRASFAPNPCLPP